MLPFLKYLSLVGIFYFTVLGILCIIEFEPLKIKKELFKDNAYGSFFASGLNLLSFIIISIKVKSDDNSSKIITRDSKIKLNSINDNSNSNTFTEPLMS